MSESISVIEGFVLRVGSDLYLCNNPKRNSMKEPDYVFTHYLSEAFIFDYFERNGLKKVAKESGGKFLRITRTITEGEDES